MSGTIDKEFRPLAKQLRRAGLRLVQGKKHIKIYDGDTMVGVLPGSSSDHRALKNALSQLRRQGVKV